MLMLAIASVGKTFVMPNMYVNKCGIYKKIILQNRLFRLKMLKSRLNCQVASLKVTLTALPTSDACAKARALLRSLKMKSLT